MKVNRFKTGKTGGGDSYKDKCNSDGGYCDGFGGKEITEEDRKAWIQAYLSIVAFSIFFMFLALIVLRRQLLSKAEELDSVA